MGLDAAKRDAIEAQRTEWVATRRATVAALEEILYQPLPVLDHGFIRVIDYMGDDAAIVQAARVSYGKGTKQISNDRALINYLMRQRHTSPFEMCEIKLHVKLPIFVARQWIRHRTANVNEYSARYSILDREFYLPDRDLLKVVKAEIRPRAGVQERLFAVPPAAEVAAQSTVNKQGREGNLESAAAAQAVRAIKRNAETAFTVYEKLLGEAEDGLDGYGIARELARMVLPLNAYTQWYWKVDLHNLLHFLRLRHDAHAQYEIRAYAEVLLSEVLRRWVPASCAAFEQYRVHGRELSAGALEALRRRLRGERVSRETVGLGVGEWRELVELFPELAES